MVFMKYDVFISYSHVDSSAALALYNDLSVNFGLECFIYENSISGGENYLREISDAILSSKVFVFVGSADSYVSKYTIKELHFAIETKSPNEVIVYQKAGDVVPPDVALLIKGCQIASWTGMSGFNNISKLLTSTSLSKVSKISYKEGHVYKINNVEAFCLGAYEDYGHFIGLDEIKAPWCLPNELYSNEFIGSVEDGTDNIACRQHFLKYPMCKTYFPAFAICEGLGKGWSLPVKDFFDFFTYEYGYQSTWDDINKLLKAAAVNNHDVQPLQEPGSASFYWTGTEVDSRHAWGFSMKDMCLHIYEKTNPDGYVRPFISTTSFN